MTIVKAAWLYGILLRKCQRAKPQTSAGLDLVYVEESQTGSGISQIIYILTETIKKQFWRKGVFEF